MISNFNRETDNGVYVCKALQTITGSFVVQNITVEGYGKGQQFTTLIIGRILWVFRVKANHLAERSASQNLLKYFTEETAIM